MNETRDEGNEQTTSATPQPQAEQRTASVEPTRVDEPPASGTSERKKQANRENAKHSTGPKTDIGKTWVRYNALKHGLYATDAVIQHGDGKENQEEFDILLQGLQRALEPQDVMQECLVRTIAETEWRLRRAARAEVGEIRRQTDSYYARQALQLFDDRLFLDSSSPFWSTEENKKGARNTVLQIEGTLPLLEQVREELAGRGYVGDALQKKLDSTYGKNHIIASQCHLISQLAQYQQVDEGRSSSPDTEAGGGHAGSGGGVLEEQKKKTLQLIDYFVGQLKEILTGLQQAEARELQAALMAHNLPSREFVDTLIRYETSLVNRKEKAIKLLLRLQGK